MYTTTGKRQATLQENKERIFDGTYSRRNTVNW